MGLQFHWADKISDPEHETKLWNEVVKIQITPTDDTWGLAYYQSTIGGSFMYASIPIQPQNMLGIDIKTETVVPTPMVVTGNKVEIKTLNLSSQ